jgi:hypothetical protein
MGAAYRGEVEVMGNNTRGVTGQSQDREEKMMFLQANGNCRCLEGQKLQDMRS